MKFNFKEASSQQNSRKGRVLKVTVLAALIFGATVSQANAVGLGVQLGGGFGVITTFTRAFGLGGAGSVWGVFDIKMIIPHRYGGSNWFGQGEWGYHSLNLFDLSYNVGYQFKVGGDKFIVAPYAGLELPTLIGIGVNAGCIFRIMAGRIGDVVIDARYNAGTGFLGWTRHPVAVTVDVGYVFLIGKDRR